MDNRYPLKEYTKVEVIMLSYFEWNLTIPTASHFVDLVSGEDGDLFRSAFL